MEKAYGAFLVRHNIFIERDTLIERPPPPRAQRRSRSTSSGAELLSLTLGVSPLALLSLFWMWALPYDLPPLEFGTVSLFEQSWARGSLISELGHAQQWWRLWSAPLAHASAEHLTANLLTLAITLGVAWRALRWGGVHRGLWLVSLVYHGAVLCFVARALSAGGWSGGLSGGVLALMAYVALELARARSLALWPWGAVLLTYGLGAGGEQVDQLIHSIGLLVGFVAWVLARALKRDARWGHIFLVAALTLLPLSVAWRQLHHLDERWGAWRPHPIVSELDGPAMGNGLCYVGLVSPERAERAPWRRTPKTKALPLVDGRRLLITPVSDETSAVTLHPSQAEGELLGAVCLSPLHLWPPGPRRQAWLQSLIDQLERARAHSSP